VARTLLTLALAGLALTAPGAYAQQADVARGTALRTSGPETATYEIEASSGPIGEGAAGLITRTFVGPGGNSTVVADVTCLAVDGNRAALIGRVRPEESVNVGYQAILIRIFDGTPVLQPDAVATGVDPQFGSEITFTECASFLDPFPTQPITAGDFQVIDAAAPPPPLPPTGCEEDDDEQGDGDDDDCDDDDQGEDEDED
jgi:hypothetical protein